MHAEISNCNAGGSLTSILKGGTSVSWNEAPRSKLLGITELKSSELPEIFAGDSASAAGQRALLFMMRALLIAMA